MAYNCKTLTSGQLEITAGCISQGQVYCATEPNVLFTDCESLKNKLDSYCSSYGTNATLNCFDKTKNQYIYQQIKQQNTSNKLYIKNIVINILFINILLILIYK